MTFPQAFNWKDIWCRYIEWFSSIIHKNKMSENQS